MICAVLTKVPTEPKELQSPRLSEVDPLSTGPGRRPGLLGLYKGRRRIIVYSYCYSYYYDGYYYFY